MVQASSKNKQLIQNALTREKPVVLASAAPTPTSAVPPPSTTALSTISSNSVTKTGPKKPLLVLTPVDGTDAKTKKTAAEVQEVNATHTHQYLKF